MTHCPLIYKWLPLFPAVWFFVYRNMPRAARRARQQRAVAAIVNGPAARRGLRTRRNAAAAGQLPAAAQQGAPPPVVQQPTAHPPAAQQLPVQPGTGDQGDVQQPDAILPAGQAANQTPAGDVIRMSKEDLSSFAQSIANNTIQGLVTRGLITQAESDDKETGTATGAAGSSEAVKVNEQTRAFTAEIMTGEPLNTNNLVSPAPIPTYSGGIALDIHVPQATRTKIWNNEYVHLADLLIKDKERLNAAVKFSPDGQVMVEQNPRKIYSIEKWTEAFNIYAAIYSKKFPSEMPFVIKHMSMVRKVYDKGGDWLEYDRQYRRYRQEYNTPWSTFISEIYTDAVAGANHSGKRQNSNNNFQPGNKTQFKKGFKKPFIRDEQHPLGYCWSYLDGRDCTCDRSSPNAWKHQCSLCDKKHALKLCPKNAAPKANFRPQGAGKQSSNPSEST